MLKKLRVLELGHFISAPFCAKMLSDLGATVIKVEPPGKGDSSRYYGPFPKNNSDIEMSGLYLCLNNNKSGITLDVECSEGREIFLALVRKCDILIENYLPEDISRIALDYPNTSRVNKSLIHCSLTPFGSTGPYSCYSGSDIHCCSMSGATWSGGSPDREPLSIPLHQSDYQLGINGAAAIMLALRQRLMQNEGQHIDISGSDVMASYVGTNSILYTHYGLQWQRAGSRAYGAGGLYPYGIFPCNDGYVCIIARTAHDWDKLIQALGNPKWAHNPRYRDQKRMGKDYPDEVDSLLIPILKKYTKCELFQMAREWGFPLAPLRDIKEAIEEPHLAARKVFRKIDYEGIGELRFVRPPYQFSSYKFKLPRPAPLLGEHNSSVYREILLMDEDKLSDLKERGII